MFRVLKSHPLVSYFVLTYAISWLTLGLVALASHELLSFHIPSVLTSFLMLVAVGDRFLQLCSLLRRSPTKTVAASFPGNC